MLGLQDPGDRVGIGRERKGCVGSQLPGRAQGEEEWWLLWSPGWEAAPLGWGRHSWGRLGAEEGGLWVYVRGEVLVSGVGALGIPVPLPLPFLSALISSGVYPWVCLLGLPASLAIPGRSSESSAHNSHLGQCPLWCLSPLF